MVAIWGARPQLRALPVVLMSRWRMGPARQGAVRTLLVADGEREAAHVRHIIGLLLLASAWHARTCREMQHSVM